MSDPASGKTVENKQRLQILNAAATCFSSHGIDMTSVDDIAHELGATKGKIYYHFRTKREIVLEVWRQSVLLVIEGADAVTKPGQSPAEKIFSMAYSHAMTMMVDQEFHRTAIECMRRPPLQVSSASERALAKKIKEGQRSYENRYHSVIYDGIRCGDFSQ